MISRRPVNFYEAGSGQEMNRVDWFTLLFEVTRVNVDDLIRLYEQPESFSNDEIVHILMKFMAHVPNHVAAAKKLAGLGPIEDVFEVGVLQEDK